MKSVGVELLTEAIASPPKFLPVASVSMIPPHDTVIITNTIATLATFKMFFFIISTAIDIRFVQEHGNCLVSGPHDVCSIITDP